MYSEIAPDPQLQPFLECLWTIRIEGGATSAHRVLPDGCADLIFDLAPGRETAFWVGTMTKTLVVEDGRPRDLIGLRFHPGGARGLLGLPLKELTDQRASFQSITPGVEEVLDDLLLGIVSTDMKESVRFYRLLGLDFPDSGEDHLEAAASSGLRVMLDAEDLMKQIYPGWVRPVGQGIMLAFRCKSPKHVDEAFQKVTSAGFKAKKEHWDAFWGQRYASVIDPDGNSVDLFAPL